MRWVLACSLLGIAGLWAWALFWPKAPPPLPEALCGTYAVVRYEPPKNSKGVNPFPPGQHQFYTLRRNGTYRISIRVMGGFEMSRLEGVARIDDRGRLCLRQVSKDLAAAPLPEQCYRYRLTPSREGEMLVLTHAARGYELYLLRRAEPPPGASARAE